MFVGGFVFGHGLLRGLGLVMGKYPFYTFCVLSGREFALLCHHIIFTASTPVCFEWLSCELIRGNDEDTRRCGIGNVDYSQISTNAGLAYSHPRSFLAGTIFARPEQDDLHTMLLDVGQTNSSI